MKTRIAGAFAAVNGPILTRLLVIPVFMAGVCAATLLSTMIINSVPPRRHLLIQFSLFMLVLVGFWIAAMILEPQIPTDEDSVDSWQVITIAVLATFSMGQLNGLMRECCSTCECNVSFLANSTIPFECSSSKHCHDGQPNQLLQRGDEARSCDVESASKKSSGETCNGTVHC